MCKDRKVVADGRLLTCKKDPPGQLSVYIPPGDTKRETYRLSTFEKYPQEAAIDPWTLARAGFYYRGYKDRVQCHGCGSQVQDWEVHDNPREAKWHAVTCKFDMYNPDENEPVETCRVFRQLTAPAVVGNGPPDQVRDIERTQPQKTVMTPRSPPAGQVLRAANQGGASSPTLDWEQLRGMYPCNNPYSPHLRSYEARLQTFRDNARRWSQVRIRATDVQMAQAGLYYLGDRDRVKCWYCNGGLQNWSFNDEPWFEHAKWFPLCEYVIQNKGPVFVDQVTQRFQHLSRPHGAGARPALSTRLPDYELNPYDDLIVGSVRPRECIDRPPQIIDPGEERAKKQAQIEKEIGNSEVIQAAFEMGFNRSLIRRAVSIRWDKYGRGYGKVATLVGDLTAMSEEEVKLEDEVTSANSGDEITKLKTMLNQDLCKVCRHEKARSLLLPCGHLVVCKQCSATTFRCPICQTKVTSVLDVFRV